MSSTITLQSVVNLASTHVDLVPVVNVAGIAQEPALSICNDTLSDLLTTDNDWKFAQVDMTMLVTSQNKQDYLFAGASAFSTSYGGLTTGSASTGAAIATTNGVTVANGLVTVQTLEPHRFKVGDTVFHTGLVMTTGTASAYNSTYSDDGTKSGWSRGWVLTTVTPTSYSFAVTSGQNNGDAGGAPGIKDFNWLASASMVELNDTSSPQNSRPLDAVKSLQPWSTVANPEKVCVYQDLGNGILKIRFHYTPGSTIWGAMLVYQQQAPVKTDLSQTWAPFPDHYSAVYRQAVLYRMYRYINSPRAEVEYQKLQQEIAKAQGADDAEDSDVHMVPPDGSITSSPFAFWGY